MWLSGRDALRRLLMNSRSQLRYFAVRRCRAFTVWPDSERNGEPSVNQVYRAPRACTYSLCCHHLRQQFTRFSSSLLIARHFTVREIFEKCYENCNFSKKQNILPRDFSFVIPNFTNFDISITYVGMLKLQYSV